MNVPNQQNYIDVENINNNNITINSYENKKISNIDIKFNAIIVSDYFWHICTIIQGLDVGTQPEEKDYISIDIENNNNDIIFINKDNKIKNINGLDLFIKTNYLENEESDSIKNTIYLFYHDYDNNKKEELCILYKKPYTNAIIKIKSTSYVQFYKYIKFLLKDILPEENVSDIPFSGDIDNYTSNDITNLKNSLQEYSDNIEITANNQNINRPFIKFQDSNNILFKKQDLYESLYKKNIDYSSNLTYNTVGIIDNIDNIDANITEYFTAIICSRLLMLFKYAASNMSLMDEWTHPELLLDFSENINNIFNDNDTLQYFFNQKIYNLFSYTHLYIFKSIAFPPLQNIGEDYLSRLLTLYQSGQENLIAISSRKWTTYFNYCIPIDYDNIYDIVDIGINKLTEFNPITMTDDLKSNTNPDTISLVQQKQFLINLLIGFTISDDENIHLFKYILELKKQQQPQQLSQPQSQQQQPQSQQQQPQSQTQSQPQQPQSQPQQPQSQPQQPQSQPQPQPQQPQQPQPQQGGKDKKKSNWCYKLPINILNKNANKSLKKKDYKAKQKTLKNKNIYKSILNSST